ncbi:MAG TPA: GNAT family protein [Polyangiaceae bacterium]|nr:GNAT family protein [Polyangiaceae bacterium]
MRNLASIKLAEKLGFSRMGLKRDADYFKGSTSHEYRYELSRSHDRQCWFPAALALGNGTLRFRA